MPQKFDMYIHVPYKGIELMLSVAGSVCSFLCIIVSQYNNPDYTQQH